MFRTSFATALATTLLFSACAMQDDDDIWMPPSADGKADGTSILKGSDIPSQYVTATKDYLSSRKVQTLVDVGALSGTELSVAMRADGIIANLPANGKLEAAELVRMESSTIFPTLFPEEQAALPHLWPMLQVASGTAQSVAIADSDLTVTPDLQEPGGLTVPASLQISTLDAAWQTVARRVELVFNHDSNATTIQLDDIQHVLSDPQAFTPAEVEQLRAIVVEFNKRATSVEHATAKMPAPGTTTKHTALGGNSFDFTVVVDLKEQRQVYSYSQQFNATLTLQKTHTGKLNQGINDKTVMLLVDDGSEIEYRGAESALTSLAGGTWIVERYDQMGVRQDTHKIALAAFGAGASTVDGNAYVDYNLELANGDPLVKNAMSYTVNGGWEIVQFQWATQALPDPNAFVTASVQTDVATHIAVLPPGRYQLPWEAATIDIYPEGVVMASNNSGPVRLVQAANNTGRYVTGNVGGRSITLSLVTGLVQSSWGNITLTAAQRIK